MQNTSKIMMIAILVIALLSLPVMAVQDEACIVPPDEYFLTDGPMNGQPVHDGLQLRPIWMITAQQRIDSFSGSHFLGLTEYKTKLSHDEQERVAFGRQFYCLVTVDYPYEKHQFGYNDYTPDITGVSENPATSVYEPARASGIYR